MILIIEKKYFLLGEELEKNTGLSLFDTTKGAINAELVSRCNLLAFELGDGLYYALKNKFGPRGVVKIDDFSIYF